MTINNFNKPIGYNVRQDIQNQVGGTYGERRQFSTGMSSFSEPQVQRQRDFFKPTEEVKPVERFSSNATFLAGREISQHKVIEAGNAHPKARINDNVRVAFLDKIISGSGDNRAPTQKKAFAKPALQTASTLKSSIKSTIRSTKA